MLHCFFENLVDCLVSIALQEFQMPGLAYMFHQSNCLHVPHFSPFFLLNFFFSFSAVNDGA